MRPVTVLLLAAGSSTRMRGTDKLLEKVDGTSILRRQAKAALDCGADVIVALAPNNEKRTQTLSELPVQRVVVRNATEGMGISIRAAAATISSSTGAVAVLPADMPEITADDLRTVFDASAGFPDHVVRGMSASGVPGHPVVFPSRLLPMLTRLEGDEGGRSILSQEKIHLVPLPADHAVTDLDTPEAWEEWRASRNLELGVE